MILFDTVGFSRHDIEIPDEDNEEEIIRRQRLRREQLKKVQNLISSMGVSLISFRN